MSAPSTRFPLGRRVGLRPLNEGDAAELFRGVDASRAQFQRRFSWADAVKSPEDELPFLRAAQDGVDASKAMGIFEAKTRELVGVVSLAGSKSNPGLFRISSWLRSDRQGKGCGFEAAKLAIAGLKPQGWHKIYALIDPANRPARRILQKLGFRYEGCLRSHKRLQRRWLDLECWGLLRAEWKGRA